MNPKKLPLELIVFAYFLVYIPYITLNRAVTSGAHGDMSQPFTGLQILPLVLTMAGIIMYAFFTLSGWWKFANRVTVFGFSIPFPRKWTMLSALGAAMLLTTVPLSYTFAGVSIPFMQLLMRGDVLIIAPVIDLINGRKVRWYSWVALGMVAIAVVINLIARGGFYLPPLAIVAIVIYTIGYFMRLNIMTRIAKTADTNTLRQYFVEEQMTTYPLVVLIFGVLAITGASETLLEIRWGFVSAWQSGALLWLLPISVILGIQAILAAHILLDQRENTFCVPMERSSSILGGIAAAYLLAALYGLPAPTAAELSGAIILLCALVLLSIAPRFAKKNSA